MERMTDVCEDQNGGRSPSNDDNGDVAASEGDSWTGEIVADVRRRSAGGSSEASLPKAGCGISKERPSNVPGHSVGAVQVDEQAPQLNRLFFRQRGTRLARRRARQRARQMAVREGGDNGGAMRQGTAIGTDHTIGPRQSQGSTLVARVTTFFGFGFPSNRLIEAHLVEEEERGEVVEAQPVGLVERRWKAFAAATGAFVLAVLAIAIVTFLVSLSDGAKGATLPPTQAPTFDPRPTLELIQERGHVRCGLFGETVESGRGLRIDLCHSIAAVLVGNPEGFRGVSTTAEGDPLTYGNRWKHLLDRTVDVLLLGDSHTVEREVKESSTGSGFFFSAPYYYDGMVYFGKETFVRCAEEYKLYNECYELSICVVGGTRGVAALEAAFPPQYVIAVPSLEEMPRMLANEECNVGSVLFSRAGAVMADALALMSDSALNENFVVGERLITKEPLAVVTRNTDREFSDIVNRVVQALIFGEEQGLTRNAELCQNHGNFTFRDESELDYLNGVYCVGNYAEIFDGDPDNRRINGINDGTGMIFAIPFGDVDGAAMTEPANDSPTLAKIANESLNCGVVVPDNFEGDIAQGHELVGMSVDYCRTLSAAIFIGDSERVKFFTFAESDISSTTALVNGTLDVLVGGRNKWEFDIASSSSLGGLHFSTPYFFGNESASDGASFYSGTTREDDILFASFVNCIILATIHAQENGISKERSGDMPRINVFGSHFSWSLRHAVGYSGAYNKMYEKHFGSLDATDRGRNTLNKGGPLLLSSIDFTGQL